MQKSIVSKAESIQAVHRWVRNSPEILELKFNSSEYFSEVNSVQ